MSATTYTMTLHLKDGIEFVISFASQGDSFSTDRLLEDTARKGILVVQLEDRSLAVPLSSISWIDFEPRIEHESAYAVVGAHLVSGGDTSEAPSVGSP